MAEIPGIQLPEPPPEGQDERRRTPRLKLCLTVKLNIMVPEETMTPRQSLATVYDLSDIGGMILADLPMNTVQALALKARQCRINFLNRTGLPEVVQSRIVWIERGVTAGREMYRLGVHFEDCPEATRLQLRDFLELHGLRIVDRK